MNLGRWPPSQPTARLDDEPAQPRVRDVVPVLPVPPQRLDDRLRRVMWVDPRMQGITTEVSARLLSKMAVSTRVDLDLAHIS